MGIPPGRRRTLFSVYGKAGRIFSGPMEDLRHSGAINGIARSRRVNQVASGGGDDVPSGFKDLLEPPGPHPDLAQRSAIAAYAQAQRNEHARQPITQVAGVMSTDVASITEGLTVEQAWHFLEAHGVGQVPVVNAQGVLVGLFTRAELLRTDRLPGADSHALAWRALLMQNIEDLMISPVPSVTADTDIRRVARVLLDTGLPGLPVADEHGRVNGFISRSDILRAVVADPPLDLWT